MNTINNKYEKGSATLSRTSLMLLLALGAAGIYYLAINMKSFTLHNPKRLELYYKQAKRFTSEQKKEFLKNHTGLWVFQSYALAG